MESAPPPPESPNATRPGAGGPVPMNYRILSLLWIVVSLPAIVLLLHDRTWLAAPPGAERLRALRLEQGIGLILLLLQFYFLIRAQIERTVAKIEAEARQKPPAP